MRSDVTPIPARLPTEPNIWYLRFVAWLRSGPPRSLLAVYNAEREKKGQRKADNHPGAWRDVPTKYEWEKRAEAWDKSEAERLAVELSELRNEWRNKELDAAAKLFEKGMTGTDQTRLLTVIIPEKGTIKGDPAAVRVAAELIERASKLARLALDMPTSRTVNEFENMTTEALKLRVAQLLGVNGEPDAK